MTIDEISTDTVVFFINKKTKAIGTTKPEFVNKKPDGNGKINIEFVFKVDAKLNPKHIQYYFNEQEWLNDVKKLKTT